MTMDVETAPPAGAKDKPAMVEPAEIDAEDLAFAVVALVKTLPECISVRVEGLDGEGAKVVCVTAEGEAVYELSMEDIDAAAEALADESAAEAEEPAE